MPSDSRKMRILRLIAALVIAALSAPLILSRSLPAQIFGGVFVLIGLATVGIQGYTLWRERPDPYDLARLFDTPPADSNVKPEEPEEDEKLRNVIHCHRCGTSLPENYSICTSCGSRLGQ